MNTDYTKISGGMDTESPAMAIAAGVAVSAVNYEPGDSGGLRRIDGYEAFDGHPSPADAVYTICNYTGTVAVGDTITGIAASAVVISVADGVMAFTRYTGEFSVNEAFRVGGVISGFLVGRPTHLGIADGREHATTLNLAAAEYRSDIAKPTGSGPVRGGCKLDGVLYVFLDSEDGLSGNIWKSTAAGWVQVPLMYQISFTTGTGLIVEGDTITQSGKTATVKRVALSSGAWGTNAAGRLIITNITGDSFTSGAIAVTGTECTAIGSQQAITRLPGGNIETVGYNFLGGGNSFRHYGCDGVNVGFEFDGETYVPLPAGSTPDTPNHVACFKDHLFFAIGASLQNSATGNPFSFDALLGAAEIGNGDDITGLQVLAGEALGIVGERSSKQLLGNNAEDFKLQTIAADVGGIAGTVRALAGTVLMQSVHGIVKLEATQAYGNFEQAAVSGKVSRIVEAFTPVASSLYRSRNQYRLYSADGKGIIGTTSSEKVGLNFVPVFYFTTFEYPININTVISCDDDTVYLCDDEGMVYQADKGRNFDGGEVEAHFTLAYNNFKSPVIVKSFYRATFEMTATDYSELFFHPDFTYGDPRHDFAVAQSVDVAGSGGRWDVSLWDTFYFDSRIVSSPSIAIRGNGENMAMSVYSKNAIDSGHRIDGIIVQYIPRRIQR